MPTVRRVGKAAAAAAISAVGYHLIVSGQLTVDTGIGRNVRPLGPLSIGIAAPRETVFDVIAGPYLGRTPHAMHDEIEVVERGSDMVLAAHRTPVGWGMVTTTVETVRFERPGTIAFRLVRGPVAHVVEEFALHDVAGSTRLDYRGELGTDFWRLGLWWGDRVARHWVATVQRSLDGIAVESERRAALGVPDRAPR